MKLVKSLKSIGAPSITVYRGSIVNGPSFQKYRVEVYEVEEPDEVVRDRLIGQLRAAGSMNHHHFGAWKALSLRYGFTWEGYSRGAFRVRALEPDEWAKMKAQAKKEEAQDAEWRQRRKEAEAAKRKAAYQRRKEKKAKGGVK